MFGCLCYILQHRNLLKLLVMTSMVICHQKIKGHITLNWNIQAKAIGNFEKDIYLNHLATIYTGLISFQVTTKETCILTWLHPSFLKSQMRLVFMAVHSRYGCHYLREILCSTDSWRGRGSEEFTLPHLLQDMGELVHINRGGAVFSCSLFKNWWEPNLESGRQEICDDLSSVWSGIDGLQSVAPGPMACRAGWMRGHAISSLQHRVVFYHWVGYMLTHIITDLPP